MSKQIFRKKSIDQIRNDYEAAEAKPGSHLRKVLGVRDLTFLGIAAVIGAGIFSTIGNASFNGGPGVSILFVITAITCGFSALCYAEFASRIPVAGSAYTYAYASFGELIAWIIGWDLLMEYAIGNIAVAISWSEYFTNLMRGFNVHIPAYMTTDYLSASRGYSEAVAEINNGSTLASLGENLKGAYGAWTTAPQLGGLRIIADLPALLIVFLITWLVYIGISETRKATNLMVILKLLIIVGVIGLGFFYVAP